MSDTMIKLELTQEEFEFLVSLVESRKYSLQDDLSDGFSPFAAIESPSLAGIRSEMEDCENLLKMWDEIIKKIEEDKEKAKRYELYLELKKEFGE